jgi:hypothetical protein
VPILIAAWVFGIPLVAIVLIQIGNTASPAEVWLPKNDLIDTSHSTWNLLHGKGVLFYSTHDNTERIYEAPASHFGLEPSKCPNVFNEETEPNGAQLYPIECTKAGTVDGRDVYTIDRSVASGVVDVYFVIGKTFIASNSGYAEETSAEASSYIATFNRIAPGEVNHLLAGNRAIIAEQNAKAQAAANNERLAEAQAYLNILFTPILPGTLPSDLKITPTGPENSAADLTIYGDANPPRPTLISVNYSNKKNNQEGVTLWEGKLSNFQLSSVCGPTPHAVGERLSCKIIPGTNDYESWFVGSDFTDYYIYHPIGDALAILEVDSCCSKDPHYIPPEDFSEQQAIEKALQPVDRSAFKHASYNSGIYGSDFFTYWQTQN